MKVKALAHDCKPTGTVEVQNGNGKYSDGIVIRACNFVETFTKTGAGSAGLAVVAISEPK